MLYAIIAIILFVAMFKGVTVDCTKYQMKIDLEEGIEFIQEDVCEEEEENNVIE